MPTAPKSACCAPGCNHLATRSGKCSDHALADQRTYDHARGSAHARGYGRKWQHYSQNRLALHRFCTDPYKRHGLLPVAATCTDHIIAVMSADDPLFWEPTNHQSLCAGCNHLKAIREDAAHKSNRIKSNARAKCVAVSD